MGGSFSISVTAESSAAQHSYNIYAVTDENSVQNQTVNVIVDALKVDDYSIDLADVKVYAHMKYAYDGSSVNGGTVSLAGRTSTTNSTGWAMFDMSSGADFSWNQTAYGVQDGTYGITYKSQNQTLPIAKKTKFIQSDVEISSLDWDGVKLTIQFGGTAGSYTLKVSGSRPVYIKGVDYDLSTDYTDYLTLSHTGERSIVVGWPSWGDFYIRSLNQGWMTDIYWTEQTLTLVLNGTSGTSGTLTVYCGSRASPQSTTGFSSTPEYNAETTILTGQYTFASQVTITLDFARETAGGTGGGQSIPAVTFTVGKTVFQVEQGKTVEATLNFTWIGVNQLEIVNVKFAGAAAEWLTLADSLPKTVTKEIGSREGYGELEIRLNVPADAPPGKYSVPAQIDAEAVGSRLTTNGWITFTIIKPTPLSSQVPDYMTYLFAALLIILVAYAYIKR